MEVTLIVIAVTQIFLSIAIVFLSLTQKDIRNSMQSLLEIFRELEGLQATQISKRDVDLKGSSSSSITKVCENKESSGADQL